MKQRAPKRDSKWTPKSLIEVLRHRQVLVYFMEFMEVNDASPLLHFWLMVETYREMDLLESDANSLHKDATSIYQKYFFFFILFD